MSIAEVMGQEDASNDHILKPVQSDDEDSDFPEFEFPVGDCGDVDVADPVTGFTVRPDDYSPGENGDGSRVLLRTLSHESPKKMPPAFRSDENTESLLARVTARLSEDTQQPEISKHVVAEDSKPSNGAPLPIRKTLQSNPSFKSLVTLLGEPLKFRNLNLDPKSASNGDAGEGGEPVAEQTKVSATPPVNRSRLSGIMSRARQFDGARTPERANSATSNLSVNALVEKFSNGMKRAVREEAARALSPNPSPRNMTSPRRTMADRSRSPVLRHAQENGNSPTTPARTSTSSPRRTLSSAASRSVSPIPRSWKDSVYGDMLKEKRPNLSGPSPVAQPPRFLTPTRAAALKAVKPPATPTSNSSKALQFTTAFGITTPVKCESARKAPRDTPSKSDPLARCYTEPAGFNFRTDERAERRKDFYSKLEERTKLKEAERKRQEAKAQEEKEAQLRELRKSLTYKANPVPRFYQEPAPAQPEIRKTAPTRAKSPNFTIRRRDSCPGSTMSEVSSASSRSPLRSARLMRCASLESNSVHSYKSAPSPKAKLPFRPV